MLPPIRPALNERVARLTLYKQELTAGSPPETGILHRDDKATNGQTTLHHTAAAFRVSP